MRTKFVAALAAGLLAVPMAASAAIVTQLIHFDDATNGWKWYSDKDHNFVFDPTDFSGTSLCAAPTQGPNNGSCLQEVSQGVISTMTRPQTWNQSYGNPNEAWGESSGNNPNPDVSGALAFTLDSFYFLLNGEGGNSDNAITVSGGTGNPGQNVVHTYTFALGTDWDAVGAPDVKFYEGASAGLLAGPLVKQTGYIASFGSLFANVDWIRFTSATDANTRLDCVVATFNGRTTEGLKPGTTCGLGNGGPPPTEIPEPGTLGLLSLALLGLGFAARRKMN